MTFDNCPKTSPAIFKFSLLLVATVLVTGCGEKIEEKSKPEKEVTTSSPPKAPALEKKKELTVAEMRKLLGASSKAQFKKVAGRFEIVDLSDSGVTDLSPLKGHPIKKMGLSGLKIDDISALKGMPLEMLYLSETNVSDISPTRRMPDYIVEHEGTRPSHRSKALAKMPLDTVWLVGTKVEDLSPLKGNKLISLDIQNTPVSDLSPLPELPNLQRLNIVGTKVTDLSPLKGMKLTRLLFTPENIKKGMEAIREMPTLTQIGTQSLDDGKPIPAQQFWLMMDAKLEAEKNKKEKKPKKEDSGKADKKKEKQPKE